MARDGYKPLIAPSLIAADFGRLAEEVARVEQAGADWLHLDVMDGHFVPNLTMGTDIVRCLRAGSRLLFDVHLMVTDPIAYAKPFADSGAESLTVHIEVVPDPEEAAARIRDLGLRFGLALNPDTPAAKLYRWLELADVVTVMTVHPGFTGQRFIPEMLEKVRELAARMPPDRRLQVDGGVNFDTGRASVLAGANRLVAGAAVFRSEDVADAIVRLRDYAELSV